MVRGGPGPGKRRTGGICDARIEPGPPGAPGLVSPIRVSAGDAHCCPSAIRPTTLTWTGTMWRVIDRTLVEE